MNHLLKQMEAPHGLLVPNRGEAVETTNPAPLCLLLDFPQGTTSVSGMFRASVKTCPIQKVAEVLVFDSVCTNPTRVSSQQLGPPVGRIE